MNDFEFWLVWSPTGTTPPSYRHLSELSAINEAERLARLNKGAEFYVLRATEMRQVDDMKRVILLKTHDPKNEGIPF